MVAELTLPEIKVSPAEHHPALLALGPTHTFAERVGCDFAWSNGRGLVGVQRKATSDFLASIADGRLSKEIAQMQSSLLYAAIVIEGRFMFTSEGHLLSQYGGRNWKRDQLLGLEMSIMAQGVWILHSDNEHDTARVIKEMALWSMKEEHRSLSTFPKEKLSMWGVAENDDWLIRVLSGFDQVAVDRARKIVKRWREMQEVHEELKGKAPISWRMGVEELVSVPGIGKPTAKNLLTATGDWVEEEKKVRGGKKKEKEKGDGATDGQ